MSQNETTANATVNATVNDRDLTSNPEVFPSPALLRATGPQWYPSQAASNEAPESGADMSRYIHALRRRWLLAVVLAVPLSAIATYAAWTLQPRTYTATAILRVASVENKLLFDSAENRAAGPNSFDVYKRTQRQWMRSRFVLMRALRDKADLAQLAVFRQEPDPADWLETNLIVAFPDESEVMHVSLSGESPDGLNTIVNSVVKAYFDEIIYDEGEKKRERLNGLDLAYNQADAEFRAKKTELRSLAEKVGTGDKDALTVAQQNSLNLFAQFQQQYATVRFDLIRATGEFEAAQEATDAEISLSDYDLDVAMRTDTVAGTIRLDKQKAIDQFENTKSRYQINKLPAEKREEHDKKLKAFDQKLADRKAGLQGELIEHRRQIAVGGKEALQRRVEQLTTQEAQLKKKSSELEADAKQIGKQSIDVEMMRSEMMAVQDVMRGLSTERERTRVEMQSDARTGWARVSLKSEAAPARLVASKSKLAKSIGAGVIWLLLPIVFVVWLDARKDRINSGTEVEHGLGLSVIGSVPLIPQRVMRGLDGPSARNQYWRTLLSESVDAIAAVLLHGPKSPSSRIVMVSSANAGEGKTTLAAHLATSLAGAGCRTALVDFDLRRPALHRVLGLSLQPGVTELLRQLGEFDSAVQATQIPNLMFIAAGRVNVSGLARLAAGELKSLFDRLRAEFDFVVVDGSPILPVVDTRLIAQHVDSVVLSVLRDVSCTPQVRAACQLLELFNVPILGVVVTGSRGDVYHSGYEPESDVKAI